MAADAPGAPGLRNPRPNAPVESSGPTDPGLVIVSDTGVFLRATINDTNVSSSFLRRAAAGELHLCVSHALLKEIRDVLTRPEIRARNARLSDEALETFIQEIEAYTHLVDPLPQHFHYERDPDDEHILNLAIEAGASCIVTLDNDLLDLMDSNHTDAREFRKHLPDITILTPGAMITRLNLRQREQEHSPTSKPGEEPVRSRDIHLR